LIKQAKKAPKATGFFAYLNDLDGLCKNKSMAKTTEEFADLKHI
jgi:hypothetical protein